MKKLFIHIGTEKTGTTTIQKFLTLNKELLLKYNYYIPNLYYDNMNHRYITAICQQKLDDFFWKLNIYDEEKRKVLINDLKNKFYNEFTKLDNDLNVIISSEHLHSRYNTLNEVQCLYDLFKDLFDEIYIIVYLRNQIDMLQSYYSTALKGGMYYESIEDFIKQELEGNKDYYDFNHKLSLWEDVFEKENIKVRIFNKKEFIDKNLINDFLYTLSPSLYDSIKNKYKTPPYLNESINNESEVLFKILNKHLPSIMKSEGTNLLLKKLGQKISNHCKGKLALIDKQKAKIIITQFEKSNEIIKDKYFPQKEQLFEIKFDKYHKETVNVPECVINSFESTILEIEAMQDIERNLIIENKYKKIVLLDGWYNKEEWGVWSEGDKVAKMLIVLPKNFYKLSKFIKITIKTRKLHEDIKIDLKYHNHIIEVKNLLIFNISKDKLFQSGGVVLLKFTHKNAKSPKELGINNDNRILGIGIEDINFKECM